MIQKRIKIGIKTILLFADLLLLTSCSPINSFELSVMEKDSIYLKFKERNYLIINRAITHFTYGDEVMFSHYSAGSDEEFNFLWRVVALPGDSVFIKDDHYSIEGKQVDYKKTKENFLIWDGYSYDEYEEIMPNGRKNLIFSSSSLFQKTPIRDTLTIPKNHYYLMDDIRSISLDSRFLGAIPKDKIKGKVVKEIKSKNFFKIRWTFYKYALWDYRKENIECP